MSDPPVELAAETRRRVADYVGAMEVGVDQATYEKAREAYEGHVATLPEAQADKASMEVLLALSEGEVADP